MFNFWWSAEWSEQKTLTEMQKNEKGPLSHWKKKCLFLDYVQLLMIGQAIWAKKCWHKCKTTKKAPYVIEKSNVHFWITFNFWWSEGRKQKGPLIWVKNVNRNAKKQKGPLSHWKIKCSFLDYVQLLMISQAIWAKNIDQNAKKWKRPPKSSKNKMFIFGLRSTSDDWPSDLSKKHVDQNANKNKKGSLSHWKIKCSFWITFNFWWSAERSEQKTLTKMQKNEKGPLSHWKIKCSFLDYIQLLMIGQAIWAKNVDRNAKKQKGPLSHQKIKCSFLDYVQLLMISQAIWAKSIDRNAKYEKGPLSHWKIKCSFLDYVQLLMIGQAIWANKCWLKC